MYESSRNLKEKTNNVDNESHRSRGKPSRRPFASPAGAQGSDSSGSETDDANPKQKPLFGSMANLHAKAFGVDCRTALVSVMLEVGCSIAL